MLLAVCQEFGIENEILPHIAMCFGGGMGLTGATCGAFSGGVMALGLVNGPAGNVDEFMEAMLPVQQLRRGFEEKMGSISCRELVKVDLTEPKAFEEYIQSEVPEKVCLPAVHAAYSLVMEILEKNNSKRETGKRPVSPPIWSCARYAVIIEKLAGTPL